MTIKEAEKLLKKGSASNPGVWVSHSRFVAEAAREIAKKCKHLDPEKAYMYGLLHDIGKSDPIVQKKHPLIGFDMMISYGEPDIAQICLSHPFTLKKLEETLSYNDYLEEEKQRMQKILEDIKFTDYDILIQLCDSIAISEGVTILEKRLFDIHLRHGFNEYTTLRWKRLVEIKKYFDTYIGKSIYCLFPNCAKITLETDIIY